MARMTPQPKVVLPVRLLIVRLWRLDRRRPPRRPRLQLLRGRRAARVGLLHPTDVWASLASLLDPDDVPSRVSRGSGRHPSSDTGECPARRARAPRCPSTYRRRAEAQAPSTSSPGPQSQGWTCSCPALGRCTHVLAMRAVTVRPSGESSPLDGRSGPFRTCTIRGGLYRFQAVSEHRHRSWVYGPTMRDSLQIEVAPGGVEPRHTDSTSASGSLNQAP
jgi:hypothetical protein